MHHRLLDRTRHQEVTNLAHSPRAITFVNGETLAWGHTPTDYCVTSLKTSTTVDISTPIPTTTSGTAMSAMGIGAFSGLGGYMTLGLGAKAKPNVINVSESEALITKDSEWLTRYYVVQTQTAVIDTGLIVGNDGKTSRSESIDWPAPPEEIGQSNSLSPLSHSPI